MVKYISILVLTVFAFVFTPSKSHAQNEGGKPAKQVNTKKRIKQLSRKQKEQESEEEKFIREAKKQHLSIQQKSTQKRMKKNFKRSKRLADNKKKFTLKRFWRALIGKK